VFDEIKPAPIIGKTGRAPTPPIIGNSAFLRRDATTMRPDGNKVKKSFILTYGKK